MQKKSLSNLFITLLVAMVLLIGAFGALQTYAQEPITQQVQSDPTFTYQGHLMQGSTSYSGTCDFDFSLYDALSGGTQIGSTNNKTGVTVNNGYFNTELFFGNTAFDGSDRYLDITVGCGGGGATHLDPRAKLTRAPQAQYASSAGSIDWSGVNNHPTFVESAGTGLSLSVAEMSITPAYRLPQSCANSQIAEWNSSSGLWQCVTPNTGWSLTGNSGTDPSTNFLGTTDNHTMIMVVSGTTAFRLETPLSGNGTPNIIGGYEGNRVTAGQGATIGGGGGDNGPTAYNRVGGSYGTVSGGLGNTVSGDGATVGGGTGNTAGGGGNATVSGGTGNTASNVSTTVGGGQGNTAGGQYATVNGGSSNIVTATYGVIGGGYNNTASGSSSTIGGGNNITVTGSFATVSGGSDNIVTAACGVVGGGQGNTANSSWATVGGGNNNTADSNLFATVSGGDGNIASGYAATIGGGSSNTAAGSSSIIGGGQGNKVVTGTYGVIGGGYNNTASGDYTAIPGGREAVAPLSGQMAYANGGFLSNSVPVPGTAQASLYVMRNITNDTISKTLYLDGSNQLLTVAVSHTIVYDILVAGRSDTGLSAGYYCWGAIKNVGGTTTLVGGGNPCFDLGEDDSAWDAQISADDNLDALLVHVTGNNETIRWVATVRTAEVAW